MKRLNKLFASFFGLGYLPFMPGTWGSIGGVASGVIILHFLGRPLLLIFLSFLFLLGWISTRIIIKENPENHDPKFIVVDEVVGQGIPLFFSSLSPLSIFLGFILFRIFDIWKPLFIKKIEAIGGSFSKSAFAVMADDVLAGIYAAICLTFLQVIFKI